MLRRLGTGHIALGAALVAVTASTFTACVDLGGISGAPCPPSETNVDGRCVPIPPIETPDAGPPAEAAPPPSCVGVTCGPHGACDIASGTPTCVCATGYARANDTCVWRGVIKDPGLQNQPQAWTLAGGAVLDPAMVAALDPVDPGIVKFTGELSCDPKATLSQKFAMPTLADAEPLAIEIHAHQSNVQQMAWTLNGLSNLFLAGFAGRTAKERVCLGERAYGGEASLTIAPTGASICTSPAQRYVNVDRVDIVPAPECPAPGTVLNGNFEAAGGWLASADVGATGEVSNGEGNGASRGGRLYAPSRCEAASVMGSMSPPLSSLPRPALAFTFKGTSGATMRVRAGAGRLGEVGALGEVTGTGTFQPARVCIPEGLKGSIANLVFELAKGDATTCAGSGAREFAFDDLSFVSDDACPDAAAVRSGDFEKTFPVTTTGLVSPWVFESRVAFPPGAYVASGAGHTGTRSLLLVALQTCTRAKAQQLVSFPQNGPAGGAALKFWYKLDEPLPLATTFSVAIGSATPLPLTVTADWTQSTICRPISAGRSELFSITAAGTSDVCDTAILSEYLSVDDVEVTLDPSCALP